MVAENFGCKAMIYVKDEDGLYSANPKTIAGRRRSSRGSRSTEMKARGLAGLDRRVPGVRPDDVGPARPVRCRSSTGWCPGNITRALAGEHVGTIITAD